MAYGKENSGFRLNETCLYSSDLPFSSAKGPLETSFAEFIVYNAQPSDSGKYSCVAQNSAGLVEDRIQLIVSEDANEIPNGEYERYPSNTNTNGNRTPGPNRGDISVGIDSPGIFSKVTPEEDLVNIVGSRAVLICNAGMFDVRVYCR